MKKLGLLIAALFLLTACNLKPGGNKGILPVTHDGNMEEVDQTAKAAEEPAAATEEAVEEPAETTVEDAATDNEQPADPKEEEKVEIEE